MSNTNFVSGTIVTADWLNDVNDHVYLEDSAPLNVRISPYLAKGDGTTDDSSAIQTAINDASTTGRSVYIPTGIYKCLFSIIAKNNVNVFGDGPDSSRLFFYGNGIFINMAGADTSNRLKTTWKNLGLDGSNASPSAIGVNIGWNQRSSVLLDNVDVAWFGTCGLDFTAENWIVYFNNINVNNCGRNNANGTGIRHGTTPAISDIRFFNPIIEGCGSTTSTAGGILWNTSVGAQTAGLYILGGDIEGNYGQSQVYISYGNTVVFNSTYFETNPTLGPGGVQNGLYADNSNISLITCRVASNTPNTTGRGIILTTSILTTTGTIWDTDFGGYDIDATGSSVVYAQDSLGYLRVKLDSTSTLRGGGMQDFAWCRFNGKTTGTHGIDAGHNIKQVTRNSAGSYTIEFNYNPPTTRYTVTANAEDGSTYTMMVASPGIIATTSSFNVFTSPVNSLTLTDARSVFLSVKAEYQN
jgi:hypothetical protein